MFDTFLHKWLRLPYTLHVHTEQKPKKSRATVLFIHGIGNSGSAWEDVVKKLPPDIRIITIDLLGFGASPKPSWAIYNAKTQANSVLATLLKLRINGSLVIVGHSLGALVAVEVATRYPLLVSSLILCSPPFYKQPRGKKMPSNDEVLRYIFTSVQKRPEQFLKLSKMAAKYKLVNRAFNVDEDNVSSYVAALESTILNQTSLEDAKRLRQPVRVIRGTLDPVVIGRNLKELATSNKNVTLTYVVAGHEVKGRFVPAVVKAITETLAKK